MTHSRGPDPAPRVGRALPAKWQLAAAAVAAFLLYSIWAPLAEWAGWRERSGPPAAERLSERPTADQVRKAIREKLAAMKRGEMTARDKEKLAQESPGWEAQPYEDMINEIFRLAEKLRELDKGGQPPECVADECRTEERKAFEALTRLAKQAEAEALKAHGCDERARDYAVVEALAADAGFDPKPRGYRSGEGLWNRLSRLQQKQAACFRYEKYETALKRQLAVLAEKPVPSPSTDKGLEVYKVENDAWQRQRDAKREAVRNAQSIIGAYRQKGCWTPAVMAPEGKCVPAYDAAALARVRRGDDVNVIVVAILEGFRLGAPEELIRKAIVPLAPY